jgi:ABC-type sugar transport system ATPase subunit
VELDARVTAIEPLGAETFLYLAARGTPLRARAQGFASAAAGDAVRLAAAPGVILWFDAATGARLRPEG